jgi:hypothetical protein
MNIDPGMVNQLLGALPYPIDKNKLIQVAQQRGANNQIVSILQRLPDKSFNSPQDIQNALGNMGNLGNIFKA